MTIIRGAGGGKGGEGGRSPVEAADSLRSKQYAKVLDLIAEGPIVGLVDGLKSVYLNETPLQNADGSMNFKDVALGWTLGTQSQGAAAAQFGFDDVRYETVVGTEVKAAAPVVRTLSNPNVDSVVVTLSVPMLLSRNAENGDTNGASVAIKIEIQDNGGGFVEKVADTISGKASSKYQRSYSIALTGAGPWDIRVSRATPDSATQLLENKTFFDSFTGVIATKLAYPNSAIVASSVDAEQFQSIPNRAFDVKLLIVRVPSNYDPVARTYDGLWNGTFKLAWTDNPAWCFYDLLTNGRYGLGEFIAPDQVDKWELYSIAQYCDQLVPDGFGGQEPRFTCNLYLQTQEEAYKVIQNFASIFRAITFWSAGAITAVQDRPADVAALFTNANVIDGAFNYSGASIKARHTVALVSWNDPEDFYRQKIEYVQDDEGVRMYGVKPSEIVAFGCTSRGQAHRLGQWLLYSEKAESETVSFQSGLDGAMLYPGAIIKTSDLNRAGARMGGRIAAATDASVTLDADATIEAGKTYRLNLVLPDGQVIERAAAAAVGQARALSVSPALPAAPIVNAIYVLAADDLVPETWRIVSIAENDKHLAEISALKHEPAKFALIENGVQFDAPPVSKNPGLSTQAAPTNVRLVTHSVIDQGIARTVMTIAWDAAEGATAYLIDWRRDDGNWIPAGRAGVTSVEVENVYAGRYVAQVRAVNAFEVKSRAAYSAETVLAGKTTPPPVVTSLTTKPLNHGIEISWGFPALGVGDLQRTEIWYSQTNTLASAIRLGDFPYPARSTTLLGLTPFVNFWFWARLVDTSGNLGAYFPLGAGVVGQATLNVPDADTITRQMLKDGILDVAKFAQGIEPVNITTGALPSVKSTNVIMNGGKLYRWDGTKYTLSVAAVDISGTLLEAQIADNAISVNKLAANAVTAGKLAASSVTADKIADASIAAGKLAAGIEPVGVTTGTLPTVKTTTVITNGGKLYRWNGTKYVAEVPTTDLTGTIAANQIAANAITADKIAANAVTAGKIAAGAITAAEIAAGAITTKQLAVTDFTNLVPNGQLATGDTSGWDTLPAGWGVNPNTGSTGGSYVNCPTQYLLYATVPTTAGTSVYTAQTWADCRPGDQFFTFAQTAISGGGANYVANTASYSIHWLLRDGSEASEDYPWPTNNTTWPARSAVVTAPANAVGVRMRLNHAANSGNGGTLYFTNLILRRMQNAELIVDGAITADKIAANAITAGKIAAGEITGAKLAADTITTRELGAGSVMATQIKAGEVKTAQLAANAVTANELAANAVTADKIVANAITAGKIAAAAVNAREIAAGAITVSKLAVTDGANLYPDFDCIDQDFYSVDAGTSLSFAAESNANFGRYTACINSNGSLYTGWSTVEGGADLFVRASTRNGAAAADRTGTVEIEFGSVASDGTITPTRRQTVITRTNSTSTTPATIMATSTAAEQRFRFILTRSGTSASGSTVRMGGLRVTRRASGELIVDGAITALKIAAGAVTADKIEANAVTATSIAAGAITTLKLATGAVTANELAANAVDANKISANAVTAAKIAAGAITAGKISADTIVTDNIVSDALTDADNFTGGVVHGTTFVISKPSKALLILDLKNPGQSGDGTDLKDLFVVGVVGVKTVSIPVVGLGITTVTIAVNLIAGTHSLYLYSNKGNNPIVNPALVPNCFILKVKK